MRQVKNGATIGYMRLALANKRTAIILSTGMYLKLTKNGEKHNEPAVQQEASACLRDYVTLVSDTSSFDEADFDKYTNINESAYRLKKITDDAENKRHAKVGWKCNCPHYFKHGKCKHSLAWAIKQGDQEIPEEYNMERVGDERKPGRPKKAKCGQSLG